MLEKLKEKYKNLYQTEICNQIFTWRELTRKEFTKAMEYYPDEGEREEYVCKLCVLSPIGFDFGNCYAGIPSSLAEVILRESGFLGNSKYILNKYQSEIQEFDHQVDAIICAAFPRFKLEELENWTIDKTMFYLSRAEWMLSAIHGLPIQISDNNTQDNFDITDFPELMSQKIQAKSGKP